MAFPSSAVSDKRVFSYSTLSVTIPENGDATYPAKPPSRKPGRASRPKPALPAITARSIRAVPSLWIYRTLALSLLSYLHLSWIRNLPRQRRRRYRRRTAEVGEGFLQSHPPLEIAVRRRDCDLAGSHTAFVRAKARAAAGSEIPLSSASMPNCEANDGDGRRPLPLDPCRRDALDKESLEGEEQNGHRDQRYERSRHDQGIIGGILHNEHAQT